MMGADYTQVDHLAADLAAAPAKVELVSAGAVADTVRHGENDAQRFAPVRTGFLRGNIRGYALGLTGLLISLAKYSEYVEDGTSDTAPQPFMRPAAELMAGRLEKGLGDAGEDIL